ncbi:hypothetical protein CoNPh17_CDS0156 [Staphylococcus phage S-CoN_Ph17]|nr:hypothetical protein CoNPh17_CDS0156 [Staphylococcus phage S-CoN_Ph17]
MNEIKWDKTFVLIIYNYDKLHHRPLVIFIMFTN